MLRLAQITIILISYTVYLFTISPTIYWNDPGELITATHSLGMAHSPSFPLYMLFAKLLAFLPIGSIAFKVNLISAIFGSLTILILFHIILHITRDGGGSTELTVNKDYGGGSISLTGYFRHYIPAFAGTFMLAFTYAFWLQSIRAEVYTLNTFLVGLIIYILLKWRDSKRSEEIEKKPYFLYLIVFLFGLSLCNHSLLTLYLIPAMLFLIFKEGLLCSISVKQLAISFLLLLLGLSVYLYLPIRSVHNPIMDWNDPETMENFLNAFSRKRELGKFFVYSSPFKRVEAYVYMMIKEFTFFCYWIGIVGIWRLFKKNLPLAGFTLLVFLLNMLGTISSSALSTENPDILGYLIISYLIYAIWIGVGLKFFADLLSIKRTKAWNMITVLVLLGILVSPLIVFLSHFKQSNKNKNYYARDYGRNIIKSINHNSLFLLKDDNTNFLLKYLIHCERFREDIKLFDQDGSWNRIFILQKRKIYPEVSIPSIEELKRIQKRYRWMTTSIGDYRADELPLWGLKTMEQIVFENLKNYKIYWESGKYDEIVADRLIPNGLVFRISETEDVKLTDAILKQHKAFWNIEDTGFLKNKEFLNDRDATKAYSFSLYYLGNFFRKRGMFLEASNYFEYSIRLSPNKPQANNNLGYCYLQMGRLDEAEREFLTLLDTFGYYESAHMNLGVVYGQRGDYEKAKNEWKTVLEKNPDSSLARKNLKKLEIIRINNLPRNNTEYH